MYFIGIIDILLLEIFLRVYIYRFLIINGYWGLDNLYFERKPTSLSDCYSL